jgi:hypothetical protein
MEGRLTGVRLELLAYLLPIIGRKDKSQTAGSLCGASSVVVFLLKGHQYGRLLPNYMNHISSSAV